MQKRYAEAVYGSADHWVLKQAHAGLPVKALYRHSFLEASYCLWRSKVDGMSVADAKQLKVLEVKV